MRGDFKIYLGGDGYLHHPFFEAEMPGGTMFWFGVRRVDDFITNLNDGVNLGYDFLQMTKGFVLTPFNRDAFCNANPDFSGYAQWRALQRGEIKPSLAP